MNQPLGVGSTPPNAARVERIRGLLQAQLDPLELVVRDDSHRHIGHEGARDGRGHFSVRVVSAHFEGMMPLARHRLVYAAMGALMDTDIHALSIEALAPSEAAGQQADAGAAPATGS